MNNPNSKQWPTMVGLLLAIVGVIAPILWDLFRNSAELELKQTGRTILIKRNDSFEKLLVVYDGKPIRELASVRFQLANTGSKPIREADIVAPPTVHFLDSSPILDVRIESVFPQNLVASIQRNPITTNISLSFPLLNPGDNIQFVVLLADVRSIQFQADARIAGLSKLKVAIQADESAKADRKFSWTVYPVGAFSLLLTIAAIVGSGQIPKERRFKIMLKEKGVQIPEGLTPEEARQFVSAQLSWTTETERKLTLEFLETLPKGEAIPGVHRERLAQLMRDCAATAVSNVSVVIVVVIIAGIGGAYIIAQVL